MKSFEDKIKKLQEVKMTGQEKEMGRNALLSFIDANPKSTPRTRIPSPYVYRSFSVHLMKGFALVALFLVISTSGIAFASGNALPGDTLYPIKIHIVENVREVLAFTTESKARVQAAHIETRLAEIDILKSEGRLEDGTATEAEVAFTNDSEALTESLAKLSDEGKKDIRVAIVDGLRPSLEKSDTSDASVSVSAAATLMAPIATENIDTGNDTGDKATSTEDTKDEKKIAKDEQSSPEKTSLFAVIHSQKEKIFAGTGDESENYGIAIKNDGHYENSDNGRSGSAKESAGLNTSVKTNGEDKQITDEVTASSYGIVKGKVDIGPICPVESLDHPCEVPKETYTSRIVVVYSKDKHEEIARTNLKEDGTYVIKLPAGTYTIETASSGFIKTSNLQKDFTIENGKTIEVNFSIDTGIR